MAGAHLSIKISKSPLFIHKNRAEADNGFLANWDHIWLTLGGFDHESREIPRHEHTAISSDVFEYTESGLRTVVSRIATR